jgi:hypothetical protein
MEGKMVNLDFLCMKAAQEMMVCAGTGGDKENVATKGLGVLLENGPYGLMLYLETQPEKNKEIAACYKRHLLGLCREELVASYLSAKTPSNADFNKNMEWLRNLALNLDNYLFTKRLWQQALTYARYHAKALGE